MLIQARDLALRLDAPLSLSLFKSLHTRAHARVESRVGASDDHDSAHRGGRGARGHGGRAQLFGLTIRLFMCVYIYIERER